MSVRFVADEHIARSLIAGLHRHVQEIDIVRVQDVGLRTVDDPRILQWAADAGRALLTQDIRTMPDFAHERVRQGLTMPGVFVLPTTLPVATVLEDLAMIVIASNAEEWANRVVYLPLR